MVVIVPHLVRLLLLASDPLHGVAVLRVPHPDVPLEECRGRGVVAAHVLAPLPEFRCPQLPEVVTVHLVQRPQRRAPVVAHTDRRHAPVAHVDRGHTDNDPYYRPRTVAASCVAAGDGP